MNDKRVFKSDFPCFLCGEKAYKVLHQQEPFKIVKCLGCTLVYVTPRLEHQGVLELYGDTYWQSDRAKDYGYTDYLADGALYLNTFSLRSRAIAAYKREPGRVLDVGCAAGFFLKVMEDKGWETHGVEISDHVAKYAREKLKLPRIVTGDASALQEMPKKYFDVITFWDVVEHLEDPRSALSAARPLLKDDGILIVETQNVESFFAYLLGSRWQHFKYEEHLYHFAPITLRMLLAQAGYQIVENTPRLGGKKVSLSFIIERVGKINPLFTKLLTPMKIIGHWNLYLNFYDEMIAVARKSALG